MGPTASGKTDLAVELVARLPLDIISVDSALVYRGLDIGTAKPDQRVLSSAPHRLVDICEPSEVYSAARFRDDALREMAATTGTGRVPLLVGGTMLYFRALEKGLAPLPEADPDVRFRLKADVERLGLVAMHRRLAAVDPESAERIHPNDPQRILRALEVHELTGRPLSALHRASSGEPFGYRLLKLVRAPRSRDQLRACIAERFDAMLKAGFEDEVRALLARGDLDPAAPALRAVGYRQMVQYLTGTLTRAEMIRRAVDATRQLAKRQMTWLRAENGAVWLEEGVAGREEALRLIGDLIERI